MPHLVFIGSGIATSYALIPLLDRFQSTTENENLRLTILDKNNDFFKGLPYGKSSGKSVLLIQDLKNFIPDPYRTHFKNWMNAELDGLIQTFLEHGGHYAQKWVEKNAPRYEKGDWDDLYIPRFFFGDYIENEVRDRIQNIQKSGKLQFEHIGAEATHLKQTSTQYSIGLSNGQTLVADKVVLSIGSLPYKELFDGRAGSNSLYVKAPYQPSIDENITSIKDFVQKRGKKKTKILVLGANASGLEMIYKICDELPTARHETHITSLSSHGMMPDYGFDEEKAGKFSTKNLNVLADRANLTAKEIGEAANKDIDLAEAQGIGAATSVSLISNGFAPLLKKLSKEEMKNFACFHGNQIGQRQRCAGDHYLSVVGELENLNRFNHLKARFESIENTEKGLKVTYKVDGAQEFDYFDLVVNCLGSQNLDSKDLSPFIKGLIKEGLCVPNPSKIGFEIDEKMQCANNLYVAGPLLAGNQIEDKIFWHLEHCARIIWSSEKLADNLFESIIAAQPDLQTQAQEG